VTLAFTLAPSVMNEDFCKQVLVDICRDQIKSIVPKIEEMKVEVFLLLLFVLFVITFPLRLSFPFRPSHC
jgi:hypothetical protein